MSDDNSREWVTYIAQEEGNGLVKIGKTTRNSLDRVREFNSANPRQLVVQMQVEGDRKQEICDFLAKYRVNGDWYLPDCIPAMREYFNIAPTSAANWGERAGRRNYTRSRAESEIAKIGNTMPHPQDVVELLAPFGLKTCQVVGTNFGSMVRRLCTLRNHSFDQRVVALLGSSGGVLVRQLHYFLKMGEMEGITTRRYQLMEDLTHWDDGNNAVQNAWAKSYFGWKAKQEVITVK